MSGVLDVQEEIAGEVVAKLQLKLSDRERNRLTKRYTNDAEAYDLYLKGYYSLYKFTPDGLAKSFEYFNRAVERDPNYALAYAGLVEAYFNLSFLSPPEEVWTKAKDAALKACSSTGTSPRRTTRWRSSASVTIATGAQPNQSSNGPSP
jgi:adenylate cyclase